MGYLNNQVITIDAILTNKGRELLARGGDTGFNITQFALSDDEIDYTLYNPNHPSGSAYYGEAIQNMPLMEAFPDETQMMKYKLTTFPRGTQLMPYIAGVQPLYKIPQATTETITPSTANYLGTTNSAQSEPLGYSFTISDVRVFQVTGGFVAGGDMSVAATALNAQNANMIITNGTSVSQTVIGTTLSMIGTGISQTFATTAGVQATTLYATLTVVGLNSGARVQVPIQVTRT